MVMYTTVYCIASAPDQEQQRAYNAKPGQQPTAQPRPAADLLYTRDRDRQRDKGTGRGEHTQKRLLYARGIRCRTRAESAGKRRNRQDATGRPPEPAGAAIIGYNEDTAPPFQTAAEKNLKIETTLFPPPSLTGCPFRGYFRQPFPSNLWFHMGRISPVDIAC